MTNIVRFLTAAAKDLIKMWRLNLGEYDWASLWSIQSFWFHQVHYFCCEVLHVQLSRNSRKQIAKLFSISFFSCKMMLYCGNETLGEKFLRKRKLPWRVRYLSERQCQGHHVTKRENLYKDDRWKIVNLPQKRDQKLNIEILWDCGCKDQKVEAFKKLPVSPFALNVGPNAKTCIETLCLNLLNKCYYVTPSAEIVLKIKEITSLLRNIRIN